MTGNVSNESQLKTVNKCRIVDLIVIGNLLEFVYFIQLINFIDNSLTYTQLQITKPYIALNTETYINIRQQELANMQENRL